MTDNIGCRFNDYPGFEVQKYDSYAYDGNKSIIQEESAFSVCLAMMDSENSFFTMPISRTE
jgi:hypothetical protein